MLQMEMNPILKFSSCNLLVLPEEGPAYLEFVQGILLYLKECIEGCLPTSIGYFMKILDRPINWKKIS